MNRELLQQALDALKEWDALIKYQFGGSSEAMSAMQYAAWHTEDAIAALQTELAKPEQEPVAWRYKGNLHDIYPCDWVSPEYEVTPLYTAPPRKEWVGLTSEELAQLTIDNIGYPTRLTATIEAKLRSKNGDSAS